MSLGLTIAINVVLAGLVFVAIVALHAWAIRSSPQGLSARPTRTRATRQRARTAGYGSYGRANA